MTIIPTSKIEFKTTFKSKHIFDVLKKYTKDESKIELFSSQFIDSPEYLVYQNIMNNIPFKGVFHEDKFILEENPESYSKIMGVTIKGTVLDNDDHSVVKLSLSPPVIDLLLPSFLYLSLVIEFEWLDMYFWGVFLTVVSVLLLIKLYLNQKAKYIKLLIWILLLQEDTLKSTTEKLKQ